MKDYTAREVSSFCQGFVYHPMSCPSIVQQWQSGPYYPVLGPEQDEAQRCLQDVRAEGGGKSAYYGVVAPDEVKSKSARINVDINENKGHL